MSNGIPSDIEIAQSSELRPIGEIAAKIGLGSEDFDYHGRYIAKVSRDKYQGFLRDDGVADGRLILVTGMNPTPAGEGKTTISVGLADALRRIGKTSMLCLREPSLGPCFGMKGGATGGGYSQVLPMEEINLHFTGDFHAVGLANNLLAAAIDNHIHQGNELRIDPRRITWTRVVDMNDRALREIVLGLGGVGNSIPHEGAFEITVASEVMACLCMAMDLPDLKRRLGNVVIGETYDGDAVHARDLEVHGAMTALLKDAIRPNLVQTIEGTPTFVHGGPFANIAHGTNSAIATGTALKLTDYVVTEAGFGAELGAEKFINIVCRKAGFRPAAAVIVATVRSLKMHGGVPRDHLEEENVEAVGKGIANLQRHVSNMRDFGLPVVVALNRFSADTDDELRTVVEKCAVRGVDVIECSVWEHGGAGGATLAETVVELIEERPADFHLLYGDDLPLWEKVEAIATEIYHSTEVEADKKVRQKFRAIQEAGHGHLPICMAKNPYSFSSDPDLLGAPKHVSLHVRDVRLAAGAEFVIVYCGNVLTLPGLPRVPTAEKIDIDADGRISGLF